MELKKLMDPAICGIVEQLQQAGYEAYIVGGAVRDLLLDRSPKDYDLSTSATPEEIRKVRGISEKDAKAVAAYFGHGEETDA